MNGAEKIYIFYHVFCNTETAAVVRDQIKNIHFSGIYRVVDAVYYCLAGATQENIDSIKEIFAHAGEKFRLLRAVVGDRSYERLTFGAVREVVRPEDVFCYIHSKGVSLEYPDQSINVQLWRQKMEYFLFTRAPDYLMLLINGECDVAGVGFRNKPYHYTGNFWWCRGDYYLRLPAQIGPEYHDTEMYILLGGARAICLNDKQNNGEYPIIYYHHSHYFDFYVDKETEIKYI